MAARRPETAALAFVTACSLVLAARQDRSAQVLAQARAAIGGETSLKAVTALSLKGTSQSDLDGPNRSPANLELHVELPDRFLIAREWPGAFAAVVGGFNGRQIIEQWRLLGKWEDARLGDARTDGRALALRARELVRYLIAWLLAAPDRYQVRFDDAGEAETELGRADVLLAQGANDFAARFYFDKQTHRPLLVAYSEPPARTSDTPSSPSAARPGDSFFRSLEPPAEEPDARAAAKTAAKSPVKADIKMLLADYQRDDGIQFPHKVTFEVGPLTEEWSISHFRVNPRLGPDVFQPRK
jgi:hypothetical protein